MTPTAPGNPFPGLRPFRADEAHLFFGREAEVDAMIDKLAPQRFLAVLGTSGSGKSSLVNCGLRPALHRGLMARAGTAWRIAVMRPGSEPLAALARALAQDGVLFAAAKAGEPASASGLSREQIVETTLRMSRLGLRDIVEQARLEAGVNVLVVVDQFEELFRYRRLASVATPSAPAALTAAITAAPAAAADDAAAFVNLLLQVREPSACPVFVVLTMRSDFLGDCTAYPGLAQAINDGQYLVPRLTRDERRAAIAGPVGVAGATISPVLLTRLVNDVGEDPDQLSILQHALNRTWARWVVAAGAAGVTSAEGKRGPIELRHYEAIGTMAHALDRHAEEAWAQLRSEPERTLCERLFKALTDQATDPRGVRRPARLASLCAVAQGTPDELRAVIDIFREPSRSFLMPPMPEPLFADTVIDISHESLMRVWERLKTWAADEALAAQQLRRLGEAAALHAQGRSGLWRDPELAFALQWQARQQPDAAWAAQYQIDRLIDPRADPPADPEAAFAPALRFLGDSAAARAAEQATVARRRVRRRWGVGAVLVFLAGLGAVFFVQWQRTEALLVEATAANLRKAVLQSRAMFDGQVETTIDVALLLSAAGYRLGATNETYGGLQYALDRTAALTRVLGLPGPVLGFSPDQRTAVTVHGNTLRLWDAATATPRGAPLQGHSAAVNSVAFSPDGKTLVSASEDATLRRWDAATGAALGEPWRGHEARVWSVAFSPDGQTVASGGEDTTVRLWDAATGKMTAVLPGHTSRVWSLAFSPDGHTLASGSDDRSIRLWDVATGAARGAPLQGHAGVVSSVVFSPDGQLLASGGGDNTLRRWDVASGRPLGEALRGHTSRVWSVAFSPDGRTLASGSEDQTVRLWDSATGAPRGAPLTGHKSRVWRVAFSADGASLLSASNDHTVIRWAAGPAPAAGVPLVAPGDIPPTAPGDIPSTAPGGMAAAASGAAVRSVAVSPDGKTMASGGDDANVRLWDLASHSLRGAPLLGHAASVSSLAFSPDGATLASGSEDGSARLWNVATGQPRGAPWRGPGGQVWAVAFSPDGKTLATASGDAELRLWDVASGQLRGAPLHGHTQRVWSVAFSPDGKTLVSGSDDRTLRLWEVASGRPVGAALRGHSERIWSVAFSPDGKRVASASEDGSVRLWDASTGAPRGEPLLGHLLAVTSVAFSPDGQTLASGSDDTTLRLWDARSGQPRGAPLRGHEAAVASVAFSPDSGSLVSAAEDGTLRMWDAPAVWLSRVCSRLARNLSHAEWKRFIGELDYVTQCPGLPLAPD